MKTRSYYRLLLACASLPFLIATAINIYFVHSGWHGKIPGYIVMWAGPVAPVLDSSFGLWIGDSLTRLTSHGSSIPGIAIFIWLPALTYSAILICGTMIVMLFRGIFRQRTKVNLPPVEGR